MVENQDQLRKEWTRKFSPKSHCSREVRKVRMMVTKIKPVEQSGLRVRVRPGIRVSDVLRGKRERFAEDQ